MREPIYFGIGPVFSSPPSDCQEKETGSCYNAQSIHFRTVPDKGTGG